MIQLKPIIETILAQYSLSPFGIHGGDVKVDVLFFDFFNI